MDAVKVGDKVKVIDDEHESAGQTCVVQAVNKESGILILSLMTEDGKHAFDADQSALAPVTAKVPRTAKQKAADAAENAPPAPVPPAHSAPVEEPFKHKSPPAHHKKPHR